MTLNKGKQMSLFDRIIKNQKPKAPRIFMIGVEGVGKTTAGSQMPDPIFICAENGLVGPQFANTHSFTPNGWDEVISFVDEMIKDSHGYKSLVIDTLDWLEPMLYSYVCSKNNYKNIEDFGYGKGYVYAQQEARRLLSLLDRLNLEGIGVMILSHCEVKTINNPTGDNYDRFTSKVNMKISSLFKEWCDCILFAHFDMYTRKVGERTKAFGTDGRIVQTTHNAAWDAKNRLGLPEVMPLDMPSILEAIAKGQPEEIESLKSEFEGYIKTMKPDVAEKAKKWLDSGKWTPSQLAQKVNSYRVKQNINVTEEKKEADNG